MAAARVRLSVLGFANGVTERLILADPRSESELPRLSAGGGTNYDAAFGALLERIPQDVRTLKSQGYKVLRPAVFFLSDGQPTGGEEWRQTHARLTDRSVTSAAPNIIAFGIGGARAETILAVATDQRLAFVSIPGAQLGEAVARFFTTLTMSVIESANALAAGQPAVLRVQTSESFTMAIDEVIEDRREDGRRLRLTEERAVPTGTQRDFESLIREHLVRHPEETQHALELLARVRDTEAVQHEIRDQRHAEMIKWLIEQDVVREVDLPRLRLSAIDFRGGTFNGPVIGRHLDHWEPRRLRAELAEQASPGCTVPLQVQVTCGGGQEGVALRAFELPAEGPGC